MTNPIRIRRKAIDNKNKSEYINTNIEVYTRPEVFQLEIIKFHNLNQSEF